MHVKCIVLIDRLLKEWLILQVLRRKMGETEQENDNLLAEVKFLQEKLARKYVIIYMYRY